jgi:hypothetical protein
MWKREVEENVTAFIPTLNILLEDENAELAYV